MMRLMLSELKIPLAGVGVALVAGVMLGGAMQPHLDEGDRPAGPQMFANWSGVRSTGPFDPGTTFASYAGKAPDYVMGTDWKRQMAWPDERAALPAEPRDAVRDDDPPLPPEDPALLTHVAYDDPPAQAAAYPSMRGEHPSVIEVPSDDAPTGD